MKQQLTLIYFIKSIIFSFCFCVSLNAQNDSIPISKKDSLKFHYKFGLRIGADLSKIARNFLDESYNGYEINADYRLKKKLYIAGEIGTEEKTDITDYLNITTQGSYLKGGIDYNMYDNWLDMDNMIYSGFRVGAGAYSHTLNSLKVYTTNQYWDPQYTSTEKQKFSDITAFWVELILGVKAEIFKNLYIGINGQLKVKVQETGLDDFTSVYIPGFGRTFDSAKIGVGYNYTISYRIPLYKKSI